MTKQKIIRNRPRLSGFLVLMAILISLAYPLHAQTKSLFSETPVDYSSLNANQQTVYNKITKNADFSPVAFLTLQDLSTTQDNGWVLIDLSFLPCPNIRFHAKEVQFKDNSNYSWYGEIPFYQGDDKPDTCFNGSFFFINDATNGAIGLFSVMDMSYQIFDLSGGILLAVRTSNATARVCGNIDDVVAERPIIEPEDCIDTRLKVLFLYTAAAYNDMPNINAVANLGILQTNAIFHNSQNNNQNVTLAGVVPFYQFTEDPYNGRMEHDLNTRFASGTSFYTDAEILREQYHADMVVILTASVYSQHLGFARAFNASYPDAYCMVDITHATGGYYVTAHELTHLFGARHYNDLNPQNYERAKRMTYGPFKWAGGWAASKIHYTMPKPPGGYGDEYPIPYLSNINVDYDGQSTGDDDRNNARTIRENYPGISIYKTEWTGLINNMDIDLYTLPPNPGFDYVCDKGANLTANAGCGTAPYTHEWFISEDGITYDWFGSGGNVNISGVNYIGFIKLISTDANGTIANNIRYNDFGCTPTYNNQGIYKGSGTVPALKNESFRILKNPNKGQFILEYTLKADINADIYITDLLGRQLFSLKEALRKGNDNQVEINITSNLTNGIYFLHIEGSILNHVLKFQIQ